MCAWQRNTFDWCTDDNDLTSMEWVKDLLTNSCDINLVKHVDEKFDQLYENEQGVCVCVSWPLVVRGYPIMRFQPQGWFTPHNACNAIFLLDSAHQPLPGEMLADGCMLGRRGWDGNCKPCWDGSMVAFWCPAWCVTLWHLHAVSHCLPFLPFQISEELAVPCESWNLRGTTRILTQAKAGKR